MTSYLENEINELKELLLTMAREAEAAVSQAVRALDEQDDHLARTVIDGDAAVDQLEVEIDEHAIALLTKALLATDLRLTTVTMKVSQDLERVADEATTIARRAILVHSEPEPAPPTDIPRMAALALGMLEEAMDAYANRQPEKARAVIARDLEVDNLNKAVRNHLTNHMEEHPGSIPVCLHLMVVAKSLERIGDHAKSMAEEVVYLYEAQDIRHAGRATP